MRIRVLHDYAGRVTRENRIQVGEYDLHDPDLFGCGKHLLDIGVAVVVDGDLIETVEPESVPIGYDAMTVEELRAVCDLRGIDVDEIEGSGARGRVLKDDYVAALAKSDARTSLAVADAIEFNGRTLSFNNRSEG